MPCPPRTRARRCAPAPAGSRPISRSPRSARSPTTSSVRGVTCGWFRIRPPASTSRRTGTLPPCGSTSPTRPCPTGTPGPAVRAPSSATRSRNCGSAPGSRWWPRSSTNSCSADCRMSQPFSLQRFRQAEPFGSDLVRLLEQAGLQPENWLPEYGDGQFEITLRPGPAPAAADRAVLLKELVRDLARRRGLPVSFAPLLAPDGVGNGVHLHLSLRDAEGRPVLFDPARPGRLSALGARFSAGILRHTPALTAWTAPSPVSFLRLTPHRWSAAWDFPGRAQPRVAAADLPHDTARRGRSRRTVQPGVPRGRRHRQSLARAGGPAPRRAGRAGP